MLTEIEYNELCRFLAVAPNELDNEVVQDLFARALLKGHDYNHEALNWDDAVQFSIFPMTLVISDEGRVALKEFKNYRHNQRNVRSDKKREHIFQIFLVIFSVAFTLTVEHFFDIIKFIGNLFAN